MSRKILSRRANKRDFRRKASRIASKNVARTLMRGGQRL